LVTVIDMTCVRAVDANSGDRLTIDGDSCSAYTYCVETTPFTSKTNSNGKGLGVGENVGVLVGETE
jgi:hypothetical protein